MPAENANIKQAGEPKHQGNVTGSIPPILCDSPDVMARLILRRADLVPLTVGIAAMAVTTTPVAGQQAGGARVTALSQARAVIVSNAARIEQGVVSTSGAAGADRTATAPYPNISVSVQPCDTARHGIAVTSVTMCELHSTNLP